MKKVIALVIVLGLPLVASPVGAESGLSKVKCEGIKKHYNFLLLMIEAGNEEIRKNYQHPHINITIEYVEKMQRQLTGLATQYQAFCKP